MTDLDGVWLSGAKPSKELLLHSMIYRHRPDMTAVIHTHSFYATLWSCLVSDEDGIPAYTPYLRLRVGTVRAVPYGEPGSADLFRKFEACIAEGDAYLLCSHGPVVCGKTMMDAFYQLEELEESAKIAYYLQDLPAKRLL